MIGANSLRTCGAQRGRQHEQDWAGAAHPAAASCFCFLRTPLPRVMGTETMLALPAKTALTTRSTDTATAIQSVA